MRFCKAIRRIEFTGSRLDDLIPSDTDCCYGLCQFFPCTVSMLPVEPCQQPALGIIFKDPSPHEFLPPSNDDMIINPFQALAVLSILVPMETSTAPKHKLSISWGSSMKPSSYGGVSHLWKPLPSGNSRKNYGKWMNVDHVNGFLPMILNGYPLVNVQKNYGKSAFYSWVNQLFLWTMFNSFLSVYQRLCDKIPRLFCVTLSLLSQFGG